MIQKTTPATAFLKKHGIAFELLAYDYDPDAVRFGLQAAEAIGAAPAQVFKTLMVKVDSKPAVVVLPADREANLKKLAVLLRGKHAEMMKPDEAERITGYKVGGISPFGQRKILPVLFEQSATTWDEIFINGGGRGLQVKLASKDAICVLAANVGDFSR